MLVKIYLLSLVNNYWNSSNLIKEVERLTITNKIFKNKILENENKELLEEIEKGATKDEVNRFTLLLFFTVLFLIAYGISSFVISVVQASFGRNQ